MSARKAPQPTVLLTGFDPFDGDQTNPSWEAVRQLDGEVLRGHRIVTACLPTEFRRSLRVLRSAITQHHPSLVLCIGLAGGRSQLALERVAINIDDARIPDNAQYRPIDVPIVRNGPVAYFSTLPIKAMLLALQQANLPVEISQSAGTFVCNHVFYGLMHTLASKTDVRGGFVHIPFSPKEAEKRGCATSLAESEVVRALRLLVDTALRTRRNPRITGGSLS